MTGTIGVSQHTFTGFIAQPRLAILHAVRSRVTDLPARLGARVKQLRQGRRMTQEQLAERAGLSYKFVGEVERGRANPTLTTLAALADALGVTLIDVLGIDGDRPRLSPRQASQVREALASLETLVDLAAPPPASKPPRR